MDITRMSPYLCRGKMRMNSNQSRALIKMSFLLIHLLRLCLKSKDEVLILLRSGATFLVVSMGSFNLRPIILQRTHSSRFARVSPKHRYPERLLYFHENKSDTGSQIHLCYISTEIKGVRVELVWDSLFFWSWT